MKTTAIDPRCSFKIKNSVILTIKCTEIPRNFVFPDGRVRCNTMENLIYMIFKLTLSLNKDYGDSRVIASPCVLNHLALGKTTFEYVHAIDRKIRKAARNRLYLPSDNSNSYFHDNIVDDGLGLPSMRWKSSAERLKRLRTNKSSGFIGDQARTSILKMKLA